MGEKTAENLFLGFGCWRKRNFAKVSSRQPPPIGNPAQNSEKTNLMADLPHHQQSPAFWQGFCFSDDPLS
ncbi:hypothetical protein HMPREF1051_2904 [Neisseria sicca VK64]|uniref:Uncharacterized protein n=1 Tax=Neisseria sicca VK64 TaxID=1095748 RepID=I2NPI3_NEISI|nr:hypothetical protein HMPREF1051_2904 [Neisseria sicca VK64]